MLLSRQSLASRHFFVPREPLWWPYRDLHGVNLTSFWLAKDDIWQDPVGGRIAAASGTAAISTDGSNFLGRPVASNTAGGVNHWEYDGSDNLFESGDSGYMIAIWRVTNPSSGASQSVVATNTGSQHYTALGLLATSGHWFGAHDNNVVDSGVVADALPHRFEIGKSDATHKKLIVGGTTYLAPGSNTDLGTAQIAFGSNPPSSQAACDCFIACALTFRSEPEAAKLVETRLRLAADFGV